jgi:site-specific DNA-methyltransferase (adenine-specific)
VILPDGDQFAIHNCDNLHPTLGLPGLPDASVDAIVTDPPAGIEFMGKAWDTFRAATGTASGAQSEAWGGFDNPFARQATPRFTGKRGTRDVGARENFIASLTAIFAECLRVLKPGGHALVWALPRTSHWTATAVEDAGFEIRDVVMHLFGTGFPKSLNVGDGRGTALKPAAEHWILARKPLDGTVAANVIKHGTGALNIDACRIETNDNLNGGAYSLGRESRAIEPDGRGKRSHVVTATYQQPTGRWPANVTLDEDAARALDAMSGTLKARGNRNQSTGGGGGGPTKYDGATILTEHHARPELRADGGASRFFYVAKASRAEKDAGLDHLAVKSGGEATGRKDGAAALASPRTGAGRTGTARNTHPTVKSVALMRWLIRLITPPGGLVLDPFMGSGSTGVAALAEGCRFLGMEREAEYADVAAARLGLIEP